MKKISLAVIATSLVACSGGISNDARHARTFQQKHPITVREKLNSIELSLDKDGASMSVEEEAKIKSFLYSYSTNSDSNLVITVPETGVKTGVARAKVSNIIDIAKKSGVDGKQIRIGTYRPLNDEVGGVRMRFDAIVAEAPDCSNLWNKNLVRMPSMGAGNGARRTGVMDNYVLGQTTTASRDSSETATSTSQ